jgi:hypothetical protein
VAAVWFPIKAWLTPANEGDSEPAPDLLREVPADVRFVLDDRHDNAPELCENCEQPGRLLVTTKSGRNLHTDDGVEVRCIFHELHSCAMSNVMNISQASLTAMDRFPTFGLIATQRFADAGILGLLTAFMVSVRERP